MSVHIFTGVKPRADDLARVGRAALLSRDHPAWTHARWMLVLRIREEAPGYVTLIGRWESMTSDGWEATEDAVPVMVAGLAVRWREPFEIAALVRPHVGIASVAQQGHPIHPSQGDLHVHDQTSATDEQRGGRGRCRAGDPDPRGLRVVA